MKKNNPRKYFIEEEHITPIKKQQAGICWAFATVAMMETYVKKHFGEKNPNFSETNIFYNSYDVRKPDKPQIAVNPEGRLPKKLDEIQFLEELYKSTIMDALSPLLKRRGFVRANLDPEPLSGEEKEFSYRENELSNKPNEYYVSKVMMILTENKDTLIGQMKNVLQEYGPIAVGCYCGPDNGTQCEYTIEKDSGPETVQTICYNDKGGKSANHIMTIVGWDDDFDKGKFKEGVQPEENGAFKMKNSRGTKGGELDGYTWVSYESHCFFQPICITEIKKLDTPYRVLTSSVFGYRKNLENVSSNQVAFKVRFVSDIEQTIKQVGVFIPQACNVTVKYKTVDGKEDMVLKDKYLKFPGFHVVDVSDNFVWKGNSEYDVEVIYKSNEHYCNIPIEAKCGQRFDNLKKNNDCWVITDGGDIELEKYVKPSNAVLYLYTTSTILKNNAKKLEELQKGTISDNRIDGLEMENIQWAIQPEDAEKYSSHLKNNAKIYVTDKATGIIKINDDNFPTYYTAKIGSGKDMVMRSFETEIPNIKPEIKFDISERKGTVADISGEFPVEAAIVKVKSNYFDKWVTTKVGKDGKWKISDFCLFTPENIEKNTTITCTVDVKIVDNFDLLFGETSRTVTFKLPFEYDGDDKIKINTSDKDDINMLLKYAKINKIVHVTLTKDATVPLQPGLAWGGMVIMAAVGIQVTFIVNEKQWETLKGLIGITIVLKEKDVSDDVYIINKLEDGGIIEDCIFEIDVENLKGNYGIFKSGKNISVKNCKITTNIQGGRNVTLLGETVTGTSHISDIIINANVKADVASGTVMLAENCTLENINISGRMEGRITSGLIYDGKNIAITGCESELFLGGIEVCAGIISYGNNCKINGCNVSLKFRAGGIYAGIIAEAAGKSIIENSMANIEDLVLEGNSRTFGGICVELKDDGIIRTCATHSLNPNLVFPTTQVAGICCTSSEKTVISDCYSSLPLLVNAYTGGIVVTNRGMVERCYAASEHISASTASGVVGTNVGCVQSCCAADYCFEKSSSRRICGGNILPDQNCFAYNKAYIENEEFMDKNTMLVDEKDFLSKEKYEELKWDFKDVWELSEQMFPKLKGITRKQYYPFPFPAITPMAENDHYTYQKNDKISFKGYFSPRAKLKWGLFGEVEKLPDGLVSGNVVKDEFEITFGTLNVGKYLLVISCSYGTIKLKRSLYISVVE